MTPEAKVKAGIKKLLNARSIWYCTPIGSQFGNGGVPDFICCWKGLFIGIEAKAPGKRGNVSALQDFQIKGIRAADGIAVVVEDASELDELFTALTCQAPNPMDIGVSSATGSSRQMTTA